MENKTTELQYMEVSDPLEIEFFLGFMKEENLDKDQTWFLCANATYYDDVKSNIDNWKSKEEYKDKEYKIFSIKLPY